MIDLHCHIDLYQDPRRVLERVERDQAFVLAVTTTPRAWNGTNQLVGAAKRVRVALGLHPELVAQRHGEVDLLCSLLPAARYVGEIGLDASRKNRQSFQIQRRVFASILAACATHGGRIMSIHSRAAAAAVLDSLDEHRSAGTPILHWFSGTPRELDRAIASDCWFTVGPAMLRSAKGRQLAERMPPARLLTESDGPFACDLDGIPLTPSSVTEAEEDLARIWQCPIEDARQRLHSNLRNLIARERVPR